MINKELTCIICPRGCALKVTLDNKKVLNVEGNTCKRGEIYAKNECTNPQRTVTTTIRCTDGGVVSVKTDTTIPKDKVMECMKMINSKTADRTVRIGDIVIENVFGSNIVVTANKNMQMNDGFIE